MLVQECGLQDGYVVKVKKKLLLYLQTVVKGYAFRDQCYIGKEVLITIQI